MATVLTKFLVGIGWDTSDFDAGSKKIDASFRGVRTSALAVGVALAGAVSVTNAVAGRIDNLALRTEKLNTSTDFVYKYGNALRLLGGDAADAVSTMENLETILTNAKLGVSMGPLEELPMAGVDIMPLLKTTNGQEFIEELANQVQGLDKTKKQLVQNSLGLSDAAMRSLSAGSSGIDNLIEKADGLAGGIEQMTDEARKLMEVQAEFGLRLEGFGNQIAEKFMAPMIKFGEWANGFLDNNQEVIDNVISHAAENPEATALAAAGVGAGVTGAALSTIGLGAAGGAISAVGAPLAAAGGAVLAAEPLAKKSLEVFPKSETEILVEEKIKSVLGIERIKGPAELLRGVFKSDDAVEADTVINNNESVINNENGNTINNDIVHNNESVENKETINSTNHIVESPVDASESHDGIRSAIEPTELSGNNAAADVIIQEVRHEDKSAKNQTPVIKNDLTLKVELDGRALDTRIVEVTEKQGRVTIGNLQATTVR